MITEESYSNYVASMTVPQLKEYIHTVGKAANQRLRELEKQELNTSSAAYRYVEKIHRDKDYATASTQTGQIKFNLRVRGRSQAELRHMVSIIDSFMEARSSTTRGTRDIYKDAAETFKTEKVDQDGNIKPAWGTKEDYKYFTETLSYSKLFRAFTNMYGSDIAIKISRQADAGGLSNEDLKKALEEVGFTDTTAASDAPSFREIQNKIDEFIANKKEIPTDDGVLNGNPLE